MFAVAIIATLDTKGEEALYIKSIIAEQGIKPVVIDTGIKGEPAFEADITCCEIARAAGQSIQQIISWNDRGRAVTVMGLGCARILEKLYSEGKIQGVIGLGGSGGTSIATTAMKTLPLGVPKIMVSTLASGNTRPYVGSKDIIMFPSIVDIAGLNTLSRQILYNAALALCGMVKGKEVDFTNTSSARVKIGATMFGVTTPCVMQAKAILETRGYEMLVFHANGAGGRALEELVTDGVINAVLDVTTTEIANELFHGTFSAGPDRLEAAGKKGIPQVISLGAQDMVTFGPPEMLPDKYKDRRLYLHNPAILLMRTNIEENKKIGQVLAEKINRARGPVTLVIPQGGFSLMDMPGELFYGPEEDQALIDALLSFLKPEIKVVIMPGNINSPAVAEKMAQELHELMV